MTAGKSRSHRANSDLVCWIGMNNVTRRRTVRPCLHWLTGCTPLSGLQVCLKRAGYGNSRLTAPPFSKPTTLLQREGDALLVYERMCACWTWRLSDWRSGFFASMPATHGSVFPPCNFATMLTHATHTFSHHYSVTPPSPRFPGAHLLPIRRLHTRTHTRQPRPPARLPLEQQSAHHTSVFSLYLFVLKSYP